MKREDPIISTPKGYFAETAVPDNVQRDQGDTLGNGWKLKGFGILRGRKDIIRKEIMKVISYF